MTAGFTTSVSRHGMAFLALLVTMVTGCEEQRRNAPAPVPVTVANVQRQSVPFEITAPGTVEAARAVQVAAQVSGVITSVRFREGDEVREGQVLATIDDRPYRNALQQSEAALTRDVIQLENARRQVARYQSLAQSEYITDEQYQTFRTTAEALAAAVKSDSAAVDNARANLEYTTIRAPISGRTGSLLIKEGNLVRAPGSGPLVVVNQTRPVQVRFAVPAPYLPEIRRRQTDELIVRVRSATENVPALEGKLTFVDNAVDTTTGTIVLKAQFDNADRALWPGQFVTATLQLYVEESLVVPQPAVMIGEGSSYVFLVDGEGKVNQRTIQVGRQTGDFIIVREGLEEGETVVTDGQLRLTPGARVEIQAGVGDSGQVQSRAEPGSNGTRVGQARGRQESAP